MQILWTSLALILVSFSYSEAQVFSRPDSPACGWVTLGGAITGFGDAAGYANLSHSSSLGLLSLRYLDHRFQYVQAAAGSPKAWDQLHEVSALYGVSGRSLIFIASASAGAGIVWLKEFPPSSHRSIITLGIPIEAQFSAVLLPVLGIGVVGSVNFNPQETYADVFLTIQLGKVR
jgi:hypothetical protein